MCGSDAKPLWRRRHTLSSDGDSGSKFYLEKERTYNYVHGWILAPSSVAFTLQVYRHLLETGNRRRMNDALAPSAAVAPLAGKEKVN
jgi:hypothetical protein